VLAIWQALTRAVLAGPGRRGKIGSQALTVRSQWDGTKARVHSLAEVSRSPFLNTARLIRDAKRLASDAEAHGKYSPPAATQIADQIDKYLSKQEAGSRFVEAGYAARASGKSDEEALAAAREAEVLDESTKAQILIEARKLTNRLLQDYAWVTARTTDTA